MIQINWSHANVWAGTIYHLQTFLVISLPCLGSTLKYLVEQSTPTAYIFKSSTYSIASLAEAIRHEVVSKPTSVVNQHVCAERNIDRRAIDIHIHSHTYIYSRICTHIHIQTHTLTAGFHTFFRQPSFPHIALSQLRAIVAVTGPR